MEKQRASEEREEARGSDARGSDRERLLSPSFLLRVSHRRTLACMAFTLPQRNLTHTHTAHPPGIVSLAVPSSRTLGRSLVPAAALPRTQRPTRALASCLHSVHVLRSLPLE